MQKISINIALLLFLLLAFIAFTGCGQNQNTDTQGEEKTKISIGCMPLNEEAVQVVKELMADKGYEMEVMVFDGNNLPAECTSNDSGGRNFCCRCRLSMASRNSQFLLIFSHNQSQLNNFLLLILVF